jgi:hypothetical protein
MKRITKEFLLNCTYPELEAYIDEIIEELPKVSHMTDLRWMRDGMARSLKNRIDKDVYTRWGNAKYGELNLVVGKSKITIAAKGAKTGKLIKLSALRKQNQYMPNGFQVKKVHFSSYINRANLVSEKDKASWDLKIEPLRQDDPNDQGWYGDDKFAFSIKGSWKNKPLKDVLADKDKLFKQLDRETRKNNLGYWNNKPEDIGFREEVGHKIGEELWGKLLEPIKNGLKPFFVKGVTEDDIVNPSIFKPYMPADVFDRFPKQITRKNLTDVLRQRIVEENETLIDEVVEIYLS